MSGEDEDGDDVRPLLVLDGPPARAPFRSWRLALAATLWIAGGMAQHELLRRAGWLHVSGRVVELLLLTVWPLCGLACYSRWYAWRTARAGSAVLFRDRVTVRKHPKDPRRFVRWSRVQGYTKRQGYVRLHVETDRGSADAPQGFRGLLRALADLLLSADAPTLPTPTPEVADELTRTLEGLGVFPRDP